MPTICFDFGLKPSVFLLRKKKGTKEIRPITSCPQNGQASASNFANASVGLAVQANQPQFAVHGELPLPKLKTEAACIGCGKAKIKNVFSCSEYIAFIISYRLHLLHLIVLYRVPMLLPICLLEIVYYLLSSLTNEYVHHWVIFL